MTQRRRPIDGDWAVDVLLRENWASTYDAVVSTHGLNLHKTMLTDLGDAR